MKPSNKSLYDVIDCYCNGFVMLPFKKIIGGLTLDQAKKYVVEEELIMSAGDTRWMIAKAGSYKLRKIK
jgi:hypothetical protein